MQSVNKTTTKTGNMDYCLLQIDALKVFLGMRQHGRSLPNFKFFSVNHYIFKRHRKVFFSDHQETNFHDNSKICLRVIRRRNYG